MAGNRCLAPIHTIIIHRPCVANSCLGRWLVNPCTVSCRPEDWGNILGQGPSAVFIGPVLTATRLEISRKPQWRQAGLFS